MSLKILFLWIYLATTGMNQTNMLFARSYLPSRELQNKNIDIIIQNSMFEPAHTHDCAHDTHVVPYIKKQMEHIQSIPQVTQDNLNLRHTKQYKQRKLLQQQNRTNPAPIRIYVVYQLNNTSLDQAGVSYLKNQLIPTVISTLQGYISVLNPVQGNLKLPQICQQWFQGYPQYCSQVTFNCGDNLSFIPESFFQDYRICTQPNSQSCQTRSGGVGAPNADFVLVVSAVQNTACGGDGTLTNTIATGGQCLLDTNTQYGSRNRPLAGFANFCPTKLLTDSASFNFMVDTATHEIMHSLVISDSLFSQYVTTNNQIQTGVVKNLTSNASRSYIATPNVKSFVQEYLNCPSAPGAYLENEGGRGTAISHWERAIFDSELMIGTAFDNRRGVYSNLTLALVDDSGWYKANRSRAGLLQFGAKAGCDFLDLGKCKGQTPYFCLANQTTQQQSLPIQVCSYNLQSMAYCPSGAPLSDNCPIVTPLNGGSCVLPSNSTPFGRLDSGQRHGAGSRCLRITSPTIQRKQGGVTYTAQLTPDNSLGCFQLQCQNDALYIVIPSSNEYSAQQIKCATPGQIVDVPQTTLGFQSPYQLQCPDMPIADVCGGLNCPVGPNGIECSGNGMCASKQCFCNIGYNGTDCSKVQCQGDGMCQVNAISSQSFSTSQGQLGGSPLSTNNTDRSSGQVQNYFFAISVGYLANCPLFGSNQTTEIYTDSQGRVSLSQLSGYASLATDVSLILANTSNKCLDTFTKVQPQIKFISSTKARSSNPLSALTYLCQQYNQTQASLNQVFGKANGPNAGPAGGSSLFTTDLIAAPAQSSSQALAQHVSFVLGIPGVVDFINYDMVQNTLSQGFQYQGQYAQAYQTSIQLVIVVQMMGAYMQGLMTSQSMFNQTLTVQKALAQKTMSSYQQVSLISSGDLSSVLNTTIDLINLGDIDGVQRSLTPDAYANQALLDVLVKLNVMCQSSSSAGVGIAQVVNLAAISRTVALDVSPSAQGMGSKNISFTQFTQMWNSSDSLSKKVSSRSAEVGDVQQSADSAGFQNSNGISNNAKERLVGSYSGVPGWAWIIIGAIIFVVIVAFITCLFCCRRTKRLERQGSTKVNDYGQQVNTHQNNHTKVTNKSLSLNTGQATPPSWYQQQQQQQQQQLQFQQQQQQQRQQQQNQVQKNQSTDRKRNKKDQNDPNSSLFQAQNGVFGSDQRYTPNVKKDADQQTRTFSGRQLNDSQYQQFVEEQRQVLYRYQEEKRGSKNSNQRR